jgi:vancomycin resistance protein YoaR
MSMYRHRLVTVSALVAASAVGVGSALALVERVGDWSPRDAHRTVEEPPVEALARPLDVGGVVTTGAALGGRPRSPGSTALGFDFDPERIARLAARLSRPPVDAQLIFGEARAHVRPSRAGRAVRPSALAAALRFLPARVDPPFVRLAPAVTTQELERLNIREVVSEFRSEYPAGEPRATNIRRAAELLDGRIIPAGGTFSMNAELGKRTAARGFVPAPTIAGHRLVDSVGGGISQLATTLYNAAFFAGLELVAHTPHSLYIDRYPMGREATISWGGPELIFRNDWPAAVYVDLEATETAVTARFFSAALGRRVETETGEPSDYVEPRVHTVANPALPPGVRSVVQEAGAAGFTVEHTRRVYRDGELRRDERFRTRYEAQNAIVEVGPG